MSGGGADRFPLDAHKLEALSKAEALALVRLLARNIQHSPSEECTRELHKLKPSPVPTQTPPEETVKTELLPGASDCVSECMKPGEHCTKKKNKKKVFDISNYRQRHIALHVYYDGAKYLGFASSTDCDTVEEHLFNALIKLRLIESRATCGYSRCGRTDKGVSAVGQVIALRMRSNLPKDGSVTTQIEEMDYCSMLNKSLPEDVRILGWSEVSDGFSSRFSAVSRTYRYFFLRKNMDLTAMQRAADLLIGDHDFRNICKMDVANVTNFRREIYKAEIVKHSGGGGNEMDEVWMLEITGVAFLWHMVRCIMALLFLVGSGKELPSIISTLFDIERVPAKPEYFMAPELPLVLYSSGFENLRFTYNTKNLFSLVSHFEALFERYHLTAVRIRNVLNFLNEVDVKNDDVSDFLSHMRKEKVDDGNVGSGSITWKDALEMLQSHGVVPAQCVSTKKERNKKYERNNVYVPLLERSRAEAYDTRIANLRGAKRSRLNVHEEKKQRAQASVSLTGSGDDICDGDEDELQKQEVGGGGSTYDFFKRMRSEGTTTTEDK